MKRHPSSARKKARSKTNKYFYRLLSAEVERRAKIQKDLSNRLRQQEAVASFGEYALICHSLDELLSAAVRVVTDVLEVEFCKVLELLPGGEELLLVAGAGWKEGLIGTERIGTGIDSQSGYTLLTDEPVVVNDVSNETRFSSSPLFNDHGITRGMSVIIRGETKPWGVIGAHTARDRNFTEDDAQFLKSVANIIASSIERFEIDAELHRSRDELFVILNGVSEGVTAIDRTGRLVYANQAAAQLMGFQSIEELMAVPLPKVMERFELIDENGEPFPISQLPNRRVLQGEPKASARLRFRSLLEGKERWSIADASAIYNAEGNPILAVSIFRDITAMMRNEQVQKLLDDASQLFASSLDQHANLVNLGNLAVANLADWCTIHLVKPDGQLEQVVVAHRDWKKTEMARELQRKYPPKQDKNSLVQQALETGKPAFLPNVTEEMLAAGAQNEEHLQSLRSIGMKAAMVVPLNTHNRTIGVISLIWAESGRSYDETDIYVAQELANRAAIATENAQLYEQAQSLNAELEQRVEKRTQQLAASYQQLMVEVEERRKAESALRKSEMLLNSLFESAPDATIIIDESGAIYNVNRQAEVLFGYSREELVGSGIDQLLPARFRHRHIIHRQNYFAGEGTTRPMGAGLELTAVRKDGTEFPVDIMLSPLETEEGNLVISAIRDITEQKRLQTELAETHRRLFESIEADRRLLSQELHDGPLQELYGVALYLEGIRALIDTEEEPADIVSAKETVQSVITTLRSICGELRPPALAHFGLEKAIRSHVMKFQQSHPSLEIEQELMPDGQRLPERTRLALFRVYQNSLSNILRHAEASQVKIEFSINEEQATLKIQDNGRGFNVPQKWVELARGGHFGLVGMAERVEAVGGQLTVQSTSGAGTTIQVDVPLQLN